LYDILRVEMYNYPDSLRVLLSPIGKPLIIGIINITLKYKPVFIFPRRGRVSDYSRRACEGGKTGTSNLTNSQIYL